VVVTISSLEQKFDDSRELIELAREENDEDLLQEALSDLHQAVDTLEKLEFRRMFSGEMDASNAYLDIQAGSGGTEAQDWAEMILRLFLRRGEADDFKAGLG